MKDRIEKAKQLISDAEYLVIGGGAGLSAAAGLTYSGERFTKNFAPFIKKYGITDMYSAGFYPFSTEEERWAYWAKHIVVNRYEPDATKLYKDIFEIVANKNYFVITTNVDSQFEKAGFPAEKVFEVQGNYGYIQCSKGCHEQVYYNEKLVKEMVGKTAGCMIPTELVPKCPVCGDTMDPHLRINQYFVQDETWYKQNQLYAQFLQDAEGKATLYLELGVGYNTPGIIRYPFEQMTYQNEHATLLRLNKEYCEGAVENKFKTIAFSEDMQKVISSLMK